MNKKFFTLLFLIIFILIIVAANYYYYFIYQKPAEDQSLEEQNTAQEPEQQKTSESFIIDGVFQKAESDFIYITTKEDVTEKIRLTQETTFSEIILSNQFEVIEEKDIELSDFAEENQVSVSFFYDETDLEERIALAVKHMVIND